MINITAKELSKNHNKEYSTFILETPDLSEVEVSTFFKDDYCLYDDFYNILYYKEYESSPEELNRFYGKQIEEVNIFLNIIMEIKFWLHFLKKLSKKKDPDETEEPEQLIDNYYRKIVIEIFGTFFAILIESLYIEATKLQELSVKRSCQTLV